jgi:hypothetical protein
MSTRCRPLAVPVADGTKSFTKTIKVQNTSSSKTVTLTLTVDPTELTKTIDPTVAPTQGGLPRRRAEAARAGVRGTAGDTAFTSATSSAVTLTVNKGSSTTKLTFTRSTSARVALTIK